MKIFPRVLLTGLMALPWIVNAQNYNQDTAKMEKTILFPAISYAPETSIAFGLSAVKPFTSKGSKSSQISTTGLYTFRNQFLIESNAQVYFKQNNLMAKAIFNFDKYPENYFGIGNNTEDSAKVLINYYVVRLEASMMKRLVKNVYTGPKINLSHYYDVHVAGDGKINDFGENGGTTTGLGWSVIYDTSDNIFTAMTGTYADISSVWNTSFLGCRYSYYSFETDLRHYFSIYKNTVIAVQALAQLKSGNVPFLQMSRLGGSSIMRGYYSGRYRDNDLLAAQLEIRKQVTRKWGVVFFAGYGEVADKLGEFDLESIHQSIGAGLRRQISKTEKVNLRMDVGFVNGKANLYINIAEAF